MPRPDPNGIRIERTEDGAHSRYCGAGCTQIGRRVLSGCAPLRASLRPASGFASGARSRFHCTAGRTLSIVVRVAGTDDTTEKSIADTTDRIRKLKEALQRLDR